MLDNEEFRPAERDGIGPRKKNTHETALEAQRPLHVRLLERGSRDKFGTDP